MVQEYSPENSSRYSNRWHGGRLLIIVFNWISSRRTPEVMMEMLNTKSIQLMDEIQTHDTGTMHAIQRYPNDNPSKASYTHCE